MNSVFVRFLAAEGILSKFDRSFSIFYGKNERKSERNLNFGTFNGVKVDLFSGLGNPGSGQKLGFG